MRRVLNAGSGPPSNRQLHPLFTKGEWDEIRLDIDPQASAHLTGSIVDMSTLIAAQSFDAVWSSHSLEHLYAHEVPRALSEFVRILKAGRIRLDQLPGLGDCRRFGCGTGSGSSRLHVARGTDYSP